MSTSTIRRCVDCYRGSMASRCDECASIHRLKNNRAGAEFRAALGIIPRTCFLCGDERHNRRTCSASPDVVASYLRDRLDHVDTRPRDRRECEESLLDLLGQSVAA